MFISGDGTITTNFPTTTVTMPTYLLAFVVSDLTYESFNASNPLLQRIYATKNLIDSGLAITSLYYSEQYLRLLEEFVNNFKYQLPKLYSVAVPDHGSAMENYVKFDEKIENFYYKFIITGVDIVQRTISNS